MRAYPMHLGIMDWKLVFVCLCALLHFTSSNVVSPADVIMLLDSSEDVRSDNFKLEENFAVQLVRTMYSRENRFGMFTFGKHTHDQFHLNTYNDEQQIAQAIKYMWYSTGNGPVEGAINKTLTEGFDESKGDRDCVPNILVILTHSPIRDHSIALELREEMYRKSIQAFVMNMAGRSSTANFEVLTNSSSRVVNIDSFTMLEHSVTALVQNISSDLPSSGCGILSQWQPWTACSATCGEGLSFRLRGCKKVLDTDKDCEANLSEESSCTSPKCTAPVDGRWATWNSWSACTKTCGTGVQSRTRDCAAPLPLNNGKQCSGIRRKRRNCSEWSCPDCQKSCPSGGHLSADCQTCECTSATIFGRIMDETGLPVGSAEIYLESRRYKAIARTDDMGYFSASGICLMNEQIFISASHHESKLQVPKQFNATHWTVQGTLEKYIPAVFTVQPHDKVRMVGQSFSLCCTAVGKPSPTTYTWLRDNIELDNAGTNGTLTISSATKSHSGTYKCATETPVGVSQSDEAHISISDSADDTCGDPLPKLDNLPAGCFLSEDTTKNETVDVGTCGRTKCMPSLLQDNGTCADWWPNYCCDVEDVEQLTVDCGSFTYKTTKVKSCHCKLCISRTMISGRAIGRNNSKVVPLKIGTIHVNGKQVGYTNMAGFFKFPVTTGTKRVVASFQDNNFKLFLPITKIIYVMDGEDICTTIVIPLKPKPIHINTSHPKEIELGRGEEGKSAVASLSIQENSFIRSNGEIHKGVAKAYIHFMDPRDRESLEAANGEFMTEASDGEKAPLRTFGMFQLGVYDEHGNPLQVQKPMKFTIDSSLFNISLDGNGDPDLAMWDYDVNKGIWVENSKVRFSKAQTGRRNLPSSYGDLIADIKPKDIPIMTEYEFINRTERKWLGRYTNCDHNVKLYEDVITTRPKLKEGICYVRVSVYTDMTRAQLLSPGDMSVTINAYTQEMLSDLIHPPYLGKKEEHVLRNGRACVMAFCDQFVYLNVETGEGERLVPAFHNLPAYYPIKSTKNREVKFESRYFGPEFDGPVFPYTNRSGCEASTHGKSFNFAPFTKISQMSYAAGSENVYNKKLSWYPVSPEEATFRSCFFKVLLKIYGTYDIRVVATSYLQDFTGDDQFGTHIVSPTWKPTVPDLSVRGACMEYRCPGYIKDGSTEIFNQSTAVEMQLRTRNSSLKCTLKIHDELKQDVKPVTNNIKGDIGLRFTSRSGVNYGSHFGIFINDNHRKDVEKYCRSGLDAGPKFDGLMNPTMNPAVEFNCLH